MASQSTILILDDDPDHLKIYGWLLQQAGYAPIPCLVRRSGVELPTDPAIRLVILDYALHTESTPVEVAQSVIFAYPGIPILLLSDIDGMPKDIAPFVREFVRKGEPQKLMAAVSRLIGGG